MLEDIDSFAGVESKLLFYYLYYFLDFAGISCNSLSCTKARFRNLSKLFEFMCELELNLRIQIKKYTYSSTWLVLVIFLTNFSYNYFSSDDADPLAIVALLDRFQEVISKYTQDENNTEPLPR